MSDKTGIQWANATWNPVTGCTKVSQGCKNCYAKYQAWPRLRATPGTVYFGREFENVQVHPQRLDQPLRWSAPRRIFVNSMSDLFHEDIPFDFIDSVMAVMALCTHHTFQVLTKRPERMLEYFATDQRAIISTLPESRVARRAEAIASARGEDVTAPYWDVFWTWPLPNVWLGVSVEDQETANERIPVLLQTPAAIRWISAEPLLKPIDLEHVQIPRGAVESAGGRLPPLNWVVVGGESGKNARPMHPEWVRTLRDQCVAAGVAFFFKQIGEWTWHDFPVLDREVPKLDLFIDGTTSLQGDYDIATQISKVPRVMRKVGSRAAGRELDHRDWNEYPNTESPLTSRESTAVIKATSDLFAPALKRLADR